MSEKRNAALEASDPSAASGVVWSAATDPGRFRKKNEDAFLALLVDCEGVMRLGKFGQSILGGQDYIFAVSDGMGGANAGEFASKIAVEQITRLLPACFDKSADGAPPDFETLLGEIFQGIHDALIHLGNSYKELNGMGATLSLCWLRSGVLYFGHIGDSRIYHLPKDGGIQQISHDHTHVGWMYRQGKLSEHEMRIHEGRNALQQSLGGRNQHLKPHLGAVPYVKGDAFLLCTDGLSEGLWDRGLERIVRRQSSDIEDRPADHLVHEAVQTDGRDNTTALVFELI